MSTCSTRLANTLCGFRGWQDPLHPGIGHQHHGSEAPPGCQDSDPTPPRGLGSRKIRIGRHPCLRGGGGERHVVVRPRSISAKGRPWLRACAPFPFPDMGALLRGVIGAAAAKQGRSTVDHLVLRPRGVGTISANVRQSWPLPDRVRSNSGKVGPSWCDVGQCSTILANSQANSGKARGN